MYRYSQTEYSIHLTHHNIEQVTNKSHARVTICNRPSCFAYNDRKRTFGNARVGASLRPGRLLVIGDVFAFRAHTHACSYEYLCAAPSLTVPDCAIITIVYIMYVWFFWPLHVAGTHRFAARRSRSRSSSSSRGVPTAAMRACTD